VWQGRGVRMGRAAPVGKRPLFVLWASSPAARAASVRRAWRSGGSWRREKRSWGLGESGARAGIGTEKGGSPNPGAVERPSLPLAGSSFSRGKTGGSGGFARGAVLEANQGAPGFSIICESRSFSDSNFGHSTSQLYVPFFLFEMANGPVWFG
jgi:hypothetical protein